MPPLPWPLIDRIRALADLLTPAELRIAGFLVGWALLGLAASALSFTASFSSDGRSAVAIPASDARHALHARSVALAAHLAQARTPPERPLDPNRAPPEELDRLPGVGPRTALRWVAVRDSAGPFLALPDLARVRGLGPSRLQQLAPHLRFDGKPRRPGRSSDAGAVDLNHASARELDGLPGIGPALAARIVQYRAVHGRFRSPADLDGVPGVGPGLLRKLTERVRFE
jgi:competence ComEA-like helix-hairpin-helix protein